MPRMDGRVLRTTRDTSLAIARPFRLRCPAACAVPVADGAAEAARQIGQHPAVCPDPGRTYLFTDKRLVSFFPEVYAEPVGSRRG